VHTVREVADRYGVTTKFLTLALEKIGYHLAEPDQPLSAATVARFESAYGDKIRAARPAPEPEFTGETDVQPATRHTRQPKPHVMRVAHAKVTGKRENGFAVKALLDSPGLVHAIDPAGTQDGDPWHGVIVPGAVHFYGGPIGSGPPAACGRKVRAVLGDEFVPAEEAVANGQCLTCARLVAEGKGFRTPPDPYGYRSYFCEAYLRVRIDGAVTVKDCSLGDFHDGPHRARDGAEWDVGVDDYVPSPHEVGSRITKAS
jgi:hypothetical protein